MHPNDAALRASCEAHRKSGVASTRHPCRDEAKCAIHGAFTPLLQRASQQHRKGGEENPKSAPLAQMSKTPSTNEHLMKQCRKERWNQHA
jgi:hypothetical protein